MMSHFQRSIPTKATVQITTANQSIAPGCGKKTRSPNHTARLRTTPTIAAVIAESAVANFTLPRNLSMCGPPRKIQRKQGVNVAQVVSNAPELRREAGADLPDAATRP